MSKQQQEGNSLKNEDISRENGKERTRNFAFLVYPDSAPADWRDRLTEAHVEALISPLHDKDTNPDGSQKKPHWHVLVMYSSVKTWEQAKKLRDDVGGVGREEVASTRGYARYLCHMDNPEKAQYSPEDVVELGGADYAMITRRASDGQKVVREMLGYIREHEIAYFSDFMDLCAEDHPEWFDALLSGHTYVVYQYIKSLGQRLKDENKRGSVVERYYVDSDTGELVSEADMREAMLLLKISRGPVGQLVRDRQQKEGGKNAGED